MKCQPCPEPVNLRSARCRLPASCWIASRCQPQMGTLFRRGLQGPLRVLGIGCCRVCAAQQGGALHQWFYIFGRLPMLAGAIVSATNSMTASVFQSYETP